MATHGHVITLQRRSQPTRAWLFSLFRLIDRRDTSVTRHGIFPENGPRPSGSYSPAIRAGDFVFVSGQGPVNPATGQVPGDDIRTQVRQTLKNVAAVLAAAGAGLEHVVRTDVYLADIADFAAYDEAYREFFLGDPPARTTVEAGLKGIKVEINAIAYMGPSTAQRAEGSR
jgi:2-iminobutanoate/2-iminopropanoate deaminase